MANAFLRSGFRFDEEVAVSGAPKNNSGPRSKLTIVLIVAFCALTQLWADVFTILPDKAGKWNESTSYSEGKGTPGAGDVVQISGDTSVSANAADIRFLEEKAVGSISFDMRKGQERPVLTVTLSKGEDVSFGGLITNRAGRIEQEYFGVVVKNGGGVLRLTQTTSIYGLRVELTVNDGVLYLPQTLKTSGTWEANYMHATVNAPGVLCLTSGSKINGVSWFYGGLSGDGVVSNAVGIAAILNISQAPPYVQESYSFAGRLEGNVRVYARADQTFTCTNGNSSASVHSIKKTCNLRMFAIGGTYGGFSNPGSFGSQAYYEINENPTVTYIGPGEVSYAEFRATSGFGSTFTLDGGPNGGFKHRGVVSFLDSPADVSTLVLDGDHTNMCTLASVIQNDMTAAVRTTRLIKRGSGTWRAEEVNASQLNGLVAIEEGILAATTLAETNFPCSLGCANALAGDAAIVLGTTTTTGTLAYVGAEAASVATRKLALAGDGRLMNDLATLEWSGVTSADAEPHDFYVAGDADGVVRDIMDGPGKVRVVKEGDGICTLSGNLDFTGGLEVRSGTVQISSATNFFKWYRYTIQEACADTGSLIATGRLNFFNDAGIPQASTNNMTENMSVYRAVEKLRPGEVVPYSTHPTIAFANLERVDGNRADKLFLNVANNSHSQLDPNNTKNPADQRFYPKYQDPESWVGYVVRLPVDADPITSYDVGSRFASTEAEPSGQTAQSWTLDASVDGVNWQRLDTVVSNKVAGKVQWRYAMRGYGATNKNGKKILAGISPAVTLDRGLDDVSVATGARLVTDKTVVVRKITINAEGMGTLCGVRLEEGGIIDIVNAPMRGSLDVAVDLTGVTLPATFSFRINGAVDRRQVSISSDLRKIQIMANGLLLIFR